MANKRKVIQQRYGTRAQQKKGGLGMKKKMVILGLGFTLLATGIGLGCLVAYKGMSRSDFFQITATNIQGCRRTTKNMILELSGVDIHTNLLALDVNVARKNIESHEWVESARLTRNWPNDLIITVKERLPLVIVNLKDGMYYMDRHGVAFAKVLPPEDMDYPILTGLNENNWPKRVKGSTLGEALRFIKYAKRGSSILPKQNISEIHLGEEGRITMYLVNRPFPITLGQGRIRTKYYRLAKVLYRLYKSKEFSKTAYIKMDYGRDKVLVGFAGSG